MSTNQLKTFRAERARLGVTTAQLAAAMNVDEAILVGWENDQIPVSAQQAALYRRVLIEQFGAKLATWPNEFS
jgi:DNA-binding transcriptional regulator YiaG